MAEVIKVYKQTVPAMRFIGKKYTDNDRINGNFSAKWGEWFSHNWFSAISNQISKCINLNYDEISDYIGLMRWKEGEPFQYWIGLFTPETTLAPDGFEYVDFPESQLGICWVYGKEGEVYGREAECSGKLMDEGFSIIPDTNNAWWFFERYCSPRFTTPDYQGNIVLDICHFIK